jgi:molybdopterin converting factor small subunit
MPIAVVLPRALYPYTRGRSTLQVEEPCATVADTLSAVGRHWPGVLDRIMTEQGSVREHVNIFVGEESIRFTDGLATRVDDGAVIMIVAAVSGG